MRYKKFGKTNWDISVLTIGTWAIGGAGWGDVRRNDCIEAIHAMIDGGVNHIDTAQAYNMGAAERVVGEALHGLREKVYLTTKFAIRNTSSCGGSEYVYTREGIFRMFEEQLQRLQTDYVDLYIQHWPPVDWACSGEVLTEEVVKQKISSALSAVNELKKEGRVREIGLSNFSMEQMRFAQECADIAVYQPQYSMLTRKSEPEMRYAKDAGMGVMTYGSFDGGILTGAIRTLPKLDPGDVRLNTYKNFVEPGFSKAMELLKTLDRIAEKRSVSLPQIVINWNTQKPFVDTAIVGVRNAAEAKQNCAGLDWMLSEEEMTQINQAICVAEGK